MSLRLDKSGFWYIDASDEAPEPVQADTTPTAGASYYEPEVFLGFAPIISLVTPDHL